MQKHRAPLAGWLVMAAIALLLAACGGEHHDYEGDKPRTGGIEVPDTAGTGGQTPAPEPAEPGAPVPETPDTSPLATPPAPSDSSPAGVAPRSPVAWYASRSDMPEGAVRGAAASLREALAQISTAKFSFGTGYRAVVVVSGTLTPATEGALVNGSMVSITGSGCYPPIVLRGGARGGVLDAQGSGRVLYVADNSITIATGMVLTNGSTVPTQESYGAGVYLEGASLQMTGGRIERCVALYYGGGICLLRGKEINGKQRRSTFTMSGGTIAGCSTDRYPIGTGAGVYVDWEGEVTISDSATICDNGRDNKTYNGGGFYIDGHATLNVCGGTITRNVAQNLGGGICCYGTLNISDGRIAGNSAPAGGGSGIFFSPYSIGTFSRSGGVVPDEIVK